MSLSPRQKSSLCQHARKAWDAWAGRKAWCRRILDEEDPLATDNQLFTRWRHAEQQRVTGHTSLTTLSNDDFLLLRGHWRSFIPEAGAEAYDDCIKHQEEPRLRALHLIARSCQERDLAYPAYPAAICQRQYHCQLEAATEKQLWRIMYTVRSRRSVGGSKPKRKASRETSRHP